MCSRYVFGRSGWYRLTQDMPRMCIFGATFSALYHFRVTDFRSRPNLPHWVTEAQIGEQPINEKFQNFALKLIMLSFVEIGKAKVTKPAHGIPDKMISVRPFIWVPCSNLAKNFLLSLCPSPSPCKVLSKSVQFPRKNMQKCLSDSLQYQHEGPVASSLTIIYNFSQLPTYTVRTLSTSKVNETQVHKTIYSVLVFLWKIIN